MRKAIFAGTFNPIHEGHIDILKKGTKLFDHIYVVVAHNPEKEKSDLQRRANIVEMQIQKMELENIEVLQLESGLLADLAQDLNVKYLLRSARDGKDYDYELLMANQNHRLNDELETVIIVPHNDKLEIRSSLLPKE